MADQVFTYEMLSEAQRSNLCISAQSKFTGIATSPSAPRNDRLVSCAKVSICHFERSEKSCFNNKRISQSFHSFEMTSLIKFCTRTGCNG